MKIIINYAIPKEKPKLITIEQFAELHDLTMVVTEREHEPVGSHARFYANFQHVRLVEGYAQYGAYGDGPTPETAISNYIPKISGKTICMNWETDINVPTLINR